MQKITCLDKNYTDELIHVLHNIEYYMGQGEIIKNDVATTIVKFQNIIIKRFNYKNFWNKLTHIFRQNRARCCLENANYLLSFNVKTPKPLAIIEKKLGESYYVMEYIEGIPLDIYFTKENYLEFYAEKIVRIFKKLKKHHVRHRDVKADNFFIVDKDVFLLDLDDMKKLSCLKYFLTRACHKDKKRFLRNWDENLKIKKLFLDLFNKENLCQKTK